MNPQLNIQYALLCLKSFEGAGGVPLSPESISRAQGIPLPACRDMLARLAEADIVDGNPREGYGLCRPLEEIHAEEVVRAAATPSPKRRRFAMWYPERRGMAVRKTLEAVRWAQGLGVELVG